MENEIILTAKTVEEAMADARAKYGAPDKELSFTILEMPKKGFLGLGASPAKVKVTITKAIEDVDLSSLVADIRSMKTEDTPAPQKPQHPNNKQNQNHKQNQNNQKPQGANQNKKPQQNNGQKPNQQKPAQQNQQPKVQQNQQKPAAPAAAASEENLPAALRKPAARPAAEKKPKEQKKQNRPADNRPEAEKKKDLLSAVMGIKESEQTEKKPSAFETFGKKIEKAADKAEDKLEAFGDKIEDAFEKIGDTVEEKWEETADSIEDKFARAMGSFTDRAEKAEKAQKKEPEPPRLEFVTPEEMEFALDFANTLLKNMGLPARAEHNPDARGMEIPEGTVAARIEIKGDDSGILIGHHGETLDAIQYLVNLCASRKSESAKREFVKISVDIEGYREKREETLRSLARRMAAKAVKNRRNVVLEPMNPYERRIIHSEVQGIENVSTHSVGSDENRKIVITYEGADKQSSGKKRNDRRRGKGDRADKAERTEKAAKTEKAEKAKPDGDRPRQKPVRAKSIDEIQLDLSGDSTATIGSLTKDSGEEESLREY